MKKLLFSVSSLVLIVLCGIDLPEKRISVAASDAPTPENGLGWKLNTLHLKVDASIPDAPKISAELQLQLDGVSSSYGPLLFLNSIQESSKFGHFEYPDHDVEINLRNGDLPNMRFAKVERSRLYRRGEVMNIRIPVEILNRRSVLYYWGKESIVASWINAWYPTPFGGQKEAFWSTMKVDADLELVLPAGWSAVAGGERMKKSQSGEIWEINPELAISFTAGPFKEVDYQVAEQSLKLVGGTSNIEGQQARVRTFLESVERFEKWFGPAPYDFHSIVEIPYSVPGFYGASEQGYILLKSQAFDDPLNSLAVLAHEAAHAWWAILVGADYEAQGGLWITESLAQYSAIMAIEEVYGAATAKEFMLSGTGGFSRNHDAKAFRRFVKEGRDHPIGDKPSGNSISNYLADSKGAWVYHMLRKKIGDAAFFASLQTIVRQFGHKMVGLVDWKSVFQQHADVSLDQFFEQWLLWEGAPELKSRQLDDKTIRIRQIQKGEPYCLDLEVLIEFEDGTSTREMVQFGTASHILKFDKAIASFQIDPNQDLLLLSNDVSS
ncbi:MAG: M1 family aminopeptidase [Cytophagales bacterium]|nr:M1 family aminopeptidase [Cytophagales bacterium]